MNPLFYVRYEAKLMLIDCMGLSVPAELAHRRLCDYCWAQGSFPPVQAALLEEITRVRPESWPPVLKVLQSKGWVLRDGHVYHPGVNRVLEDAKAAHAAAVARGRKGARLRWRDSASIEQPSPPAMNPLKHERLRERSHNNNDKPVERSARTASPKRPVRKAEESFMSDLNRMLLAFDPATAQAELTNWGGWWRNRFRENPDKARRILADVHNQVKEANITKTPGAAAIDLWNRLP